MQQFNPLAILCSPSDRYVVCKDTVVNDEEDGHIYRQVPGKMTNKLAAFLLRHKARVSLTSTT